MSGRQRIQQFIVGVVLAGVLGCGPAHPVYLSSKGQIDKHYINSATRISYPDARVESSQEVLGSIEPYTVVNPDAPREPWDISLEEALCIAMQNSKTLRTLSGVSFSSAGVQGVPQALLSAPTSVATVYDVAITESDPRYGVEAALSAFDAQFSAAVNWSHEDRGAYPATNATVSDIGTFQASISKTNATGGRTYITNGNNYYDRSSDRSPYWSTYIEGGFTQPLLQGRGVQFNRIAGPGSIPGYYQGVSIARINTDITLTDFEIATRNLVYDVERAYWNLYYAYHYLESVRAGYRSAAQTWSTVDKKTEMGHKDGNAQTESQSRSQYFLFRQRTEQAQSNLFKAEATLRYIMGLSPTDGRFFRPSTEPTIAPLRLDWNEVVVEALARSPELRKQKWDVKKKELELLASKNYLLPKLDLSASYRANGVGKDWIDSESENSSAFGSLTKDGYGDWQAGLTYSAAIGRRKEMAAVRNAQLSLIKSQTLLRDQELELAHQLQDSFRSIHMYYQVAQTGLQRRIAGEMEVRAANKAYEAGTSTLDQVLDAQRRLAEADTEFYDNVKEYNLAITELHRRKGSLLEYNNVYLAEGPWPAKAYVDAREEARKRDAGHYLNYGYTRPQVFSRGEYQQFQHHYGATYTGEDGGDNSIPIPTLEGPLYEPQQEIETTDEEIEDWSTQVQQVNPGTQSANRTNPRPVSQGQAPVPAFPNVKTQTNPASTQHGTIRPVSHQSHPSRQGLAF